MVSSIKVNTDILSDERYRLMFSVEEVNRLAREGAVADSMAANISISVFTSKQPGKSLVIGVEFIQHKSKY